VHMVFMTFYINKIVWAGKCFGFKQWQLPSKGNSFSCGSGRESKVCIVILEGGQTATKCEKRGSGGKFYTKIMSFMEDPKSNLCFSAVHLQLAPVAGECNVLHTEATRLQLVLTVTEFYLQ
jgi:hypothetical protein